MSNKWIRETFLTLSLLLLHMGRIKTQQVKRIGADLRKKYPESFKVAFDDNKQVVQQYADFPSKKLRNLVAGYLTRFVKKSKQV